MRFAMLRQVSSLWITSKYRPKGKINVCQLIQELENIARLCKIRRVLALIYDNW